MHVVCENTEIENGNGMKTETERKEMFRLADFLSKI